MALHCAMKADKPIGGAFCISGFKFYFTPLKKSHSGMKLLAINGEKDDFVLARHAEESFRPIENEANNFKFVVEKGLPHSFSRSSLELVRDFILE